MAADHEVWVIITGKGDRPYFQSRSPVNVMHLSVHVDEDGHPKWASVFEEPTPADPERWNALRRLDLDRLTDPEDSRQLRELRQAIDQHLGWGSEKIGDYVARVAEAGRKLGPLKPTAVSSGHDVELDADGRPKPRYCSERHTMTRCQDIDGACDWKGCPQTRDGEPKKTGRHCPLDRMEDDDAEA